MKLLLILTVSLFLQISNKTHQTDEAGTLSIQLKNVDVDKGGKIYIAVFNKKENFMTENRYKGIIVDVDENTVSKKINFEDLPEGDYVISAFHDTNGNGKMDFDSKGMPIESWATSGNINPYGPPTWELTKVKLSSNYKAIDLDFRK